MLSAKVVRGSAPSARQANPLGGQIDRCLAARKAATSNARRPSTGNLSGRRPPTDRERVPQSAELAFAGPLSTATTDRRYWRWIVNEAPLGVPFPLDGID